jgi:acetyl esterase/lipase
MAAEAPPVRAALLLLLLTAPGCMLRSALMRVDPPPGELEVSDVSYWHGDDWDDAKHRLDLYVPAGPGPHPVLVFVHGGGWRFGDRQQILSSYVKIGRRLAASGVLAVVISYRLSPHYKHPAQVRDVARAVGWTLQRIGDFGGDPDRVYVMGHSAGAHLATLIACDPKWLAEVGASPSQLKGVIGVSGPYDIEHLGKSTLFGGVTMVIPTFGSDHAVWRDAMPENHLGGHPPPFLIAWADGDPELIRRDARIFTGALEQRHLKFETFQTTFDDHFSIIGNFGAPGDDLAKRVLQFIGKN